MIAPGDVLAAAGVDPAALERASELVPFVSPGHRATGNRVLLLDDLVVRVPSEDTAALRDPATGVAAAVRAGDAGLAPGVRWADPATGAMAVDRVDAREVRIEDLWGPSRDRAIDLLGTFHRGAPLGREADLFARCDELAGRLDATDAPRPPDLPLLLDAVARIGRAVEASGRERAPCHLHPVASNFLLRADGSLLAIDWDEAGDADPAWDLGALLQECCTFDDEWASAVERIVGRHDAAVEARLRLHGIADDVAWGLWAALLGGTSPRREIEFFKYASWRFMRARHALADERVESWLRTV